MQMAGMNFQTRSSAGSPSIHRYLKYQRITA
ncbi:hypothetical protein [Hungatella hathewayi]